VAYYLNGNAVFMGSSALDGQHSLYSNIDSGPDILLFNEGDSSGVHTHAAFLSSFAFTDRTLAPGEVHALGAVARRVLAGVRKANAIITHLLCFARPDRFAPRRARVNTLLVELRHAFAVRFQPLLEISANGGRERNVNDDRQDLSRDIHGGRIGMTVALFRRWTFGAAGTFWRTILLPFLGKVTISELIRMAPMPSFGITPSMDLSP